MDGRMRLVVALAVALSTAALSGQSQNLVDPCGRALTQADLTMCAGNEAARVDRLLDKAYSAVLKRASAVPGAVAKVKAAQDAWLAYRNAYIEANWPLDNKQAEYGTMYPMS